MSKNGNKPASMPAPTPMIEVIIRVDQVTGQVNVTGPVNNLLVMYGILEAAKDSCRKHIEAQAAGSRIVPVTQMPRPM